MATTTNSEQVASECFICDKRRGAVHVPGGYIYQDNLVQATHSFPADQKPVYLGYLFIESVRHTPGLADLTDEEARAVGLLTTRLSRALKAVAGAEHVYAFVLGHHIPHFHMHLIARYPGAPREYWGTRVDEWPAAPRGGEAEITAFNERLRAYLAQEAGESGKS